MAKIDIQKQVDIQGGAKGDLLAGKAGGEIDNLAVGTNAHVLTADSTQTLGIKWAAPAVASVFARTGAVVAASGDYTAAQVTNTPAGAIAAVTVQTAIDELDAEKAALSHAHSAADITSGTLAIARGGTNGATQTAAMDNLSPTTTKGDLLVDNGTNVIRLAIGTDTHVLTADSVEAAGVKWAAPASAALADPGGNGIVVRTALNTTVNRTLTAGSSKISIGNGDGVAANPTVDVTEANLSHANIGGTTAIANGGTGQVAQTAAFDALAPTTTKGDLIAHDGSDNIRLAVGLDGQVLTASSGAASGLAWAAGPAALAGGSDTQVQFNDGGSTLAGATQLVWDKTNNFLGVGGSPDEKCHIQRGVDGDVTLLVVENSQAAGAASTNETAQIRFGFGSNNDVARISAGKINDYTSAANEDSFLSFSTDDAGTSAESLRIDNNKNVFNNDDMTQAFAANLSGLMIHRQDQIAQALVITEWDTASASVQIRAESYSGAGTNLGGTFIGVSARGTRGVPTATQSGDQLFDLHGRGYGTSITQGTARIKMVALENFSGTASGTSMTLQTTPATTTTIRDSVVISGGGIVAIDVLSDGDVLQIKQGSTQEGAITVSGTTVAYTTFMGAHPTQTKLTIPQGGVVVANGRIIAPDLTVNEKGETISKDYKGDRRKKTNFSPDAFRFSEITGTTQAQDKRVYGVYVAKNREDTYGKTFGSEDEAEHLIAAVGLYLIRVTDTKGDISNGDYLTSSSREFEAEKQADDVLHSYTVAKALVNVDFSTVLVDADLGYKWKLIPATIHCG